MSRLRKLLLGSAFLLVGVCLMLLVASAIANLGLPQRSAVVQTLSEDDKVRLMEWLHLHEQLGDAVFPGWGLAGIPAILYNEEYVFLVGYPDPPDGWTKVPAGIERGTAWEIVPGDSFMGQPYYRQRLRDAGATPEAFTVRVGDRWASSMPTLEWFTIGLMQPIREDLPGFLRPVFPYRIFIGQLVSGSDQYVSLYAHEAFHAFQGRTAPGKFAAAETASQYEDRYPWNAASLQEDWQKELDLLADALRSGERARSLELVRSYLNTRSARREAANLSTDMIAYERNREWLEGLARYAELEIWRQAAAGTYAPVPGTARLPDFEDYRGYERRWTREIDQMTRMADAQGDGRFYYTGMAQAVLLDRLLPDWKQMAFDENIWLEDLLEEAARLR